MYPHLTQAIFQPIGNGCREIRQRAPRAEMLRSLAFGKCICLKLSAYRAIPDRHPQGSLFTITKLALICFSPKRKRLLLNALGCEPTCTPNEARFSAQLVNNFNKLDVGHEGRVRVRT
eukprot:2439313-Pleurochrysis_carterae.AAC.1